MKFPHRLSSLLLSLLVAVGAAVAQDGTSKASQDEGITEIEAILELQEQVVRLSNAVDSLEQVTAYQAYTIDSIGAKLTSAVKQSDADRLQMQKGFSETSRGLESTSKSIDDSALWTAIGGALILVFVMAMGVYLYLRNRAPKRPEAPGKPDENLAEEEEGDEPAPNLDVQ